MTGPQIDAKNVTKPIQLLGAWLIGLILVNAAFLTAAASLSGTERLVLVVAAIANVPIFLVALFLLQTKFRPELQEDAFYSRYLDTKTNQVVTHSKFDKIEAEITAVKVSISEQIAQAVQAAQVAQSTQVQVPDILNANRGMGKQLHLEGSHSGQANQSTQSLQETLQTTAPKLIGETY